MTGNRFLLWVVVAAAAFSAACSHQEAAKEAKPAPPEYKVRMQTTKGDVVILVHRDWAPIGADHFYELVKMGFYDNNGFFRTVPDFIVQWGMNGDPKVNRDWSEITVKDDPPKVSNKIGTVVFAQTSDPNSRTTQLFINLGDNSKSLDAQNFTPFGEVIQGMDNVMRITMQYREEPSQTAIGETGNAYLEEHFPHLDYTKKLTIVP
jgi:peptidyl-prolyl cis-trans isomerase A (cyclophilin A)